MKTKFFILGILVLNSIAYSQNKADTFYIIISDTLTNVKISNFKQSLYFKNATTYVFTFQNKPSYVGGILLNVEDETNRVLNDLCSMKVLNPYQLLDSLIIHKRKFLWNNTFFVAFFNDNKYYIHKTKGEYIYKNFEGDVD